MKYDFKKQLRSFGYAWKGIRCCIRRKKSDTYSVPDGTEYIKRKKETAGKIKELLEPIKEKVPGAVKVEVIINELDSSNRDVALISEFTDTEALAAYQVHPDHLAAKEYIGSVAGNRACLDYEY